MASPIVTENVRVASCHESGCGWCSEEVGARSQAEQHHAETGHHVGYDRFYSCHWQTPTPLRPARDGEGRGEG